jgi:hypothetical protein
MAYGDGALLLTLTRGLVGWARSCTMRRWLLTRLDLDKDNRNAGEMGKEGVGV